MRKLILFAATGAGSGYLPIAPGSWGSLVGVGVWALLLGGLGLALLGELLAALAIAGLGVLAAARAEPLLGRKDDGRITIDEVSGQLISLLALPFRVDVAISGFLLFRIFDVWKPAPARAAESLPGGLGVMADDWVAGIYANLVGQVLWRVTFPEGIA